MDISAYAKLLLKELETGHHAGVELYRRLGALESVLIMAGELTGGKPFDYLPVKRGFVDFGLLRLPNHETYREHIIRRAKEYVSHPTRDAEAIRADTEPGTCKECGAAIDRDDRANVCSRCASEEKQAAAEYRAETKQEDRDIQ